MTECEGCGAPFKPALHACDYCRRAYPRAVAVLDERAHIERMYQQQSLANAYNAQAQCSSAGLYAMLGNQQNSLQGLGGMQACNPWGWR